MATIPQPAGRSQEFSYKHPQRDRFTTAAAYTRALASYQISEDDLIDRLSWQLTVLGFIDTRFRPGVHSTDAEIQQYFYEHRRQLIASNPGKSTLGQLQPMNWKKRCRASK